MRVLDLRCPECQAVRRDVSVPMSVVGPAFDVCDCGGAMRVTWDGGRPPATDVYGQSLANQALRCEVTSTREIRKLAKERRWEQHEHQLYRDGKIPIVESSPAGRQQMARFQEADRRAGR